MFRYIPSKCNSVDVATTGFSPTKLGNDEIWWKEVSWVEKEAINWPQWKYNLLGENMKMKKEAKFFI